MGHETALKQMKNSFGGMLAFEVGGTQKEAKNFIENLKVIIHAVGLGCTETLVCIPVLTTMLYMPPERGTSFGVKPNTVRLSSAGIENADLIINDLKQALNRI